MEPTATASFCCIVTNFEDISYSPASLHCCRQPGRNRNINWRRRALRHLRFCCGCPSWQHAAGRRRCHRLAELLPQCILHSHTAPSMPDTPDDTAQSERPQVRSPGCMQCSAHVCGTKRWRVPTLTCSFSSRLSLAAFSLALRSRCSLDTIHRSSKFSTTGTPGCACALRDQRASPTRMQLSKRRILHAEQCELQVFASARQAHMSIIESWMYS